MSLLHKNTSAVSEAIFKEQRQLRRERLLASPGPQCHGCYRQAETAKRRASSGNG